MKGINTINGAISIFDKIILRLNKGVELCKKETTKIVENIVRAEKEIEENKYQQKCNEDSIKRAEKIIKNINDIIEQ